MYLYIINYYNIVIYLYIYQYNKVKEFVCLNTLLSEITRPITKKKYINRFLKT